MEKKVLTFLSETEQASKQNILQGTGQRATGFPVYVCVYVYAYVSVYAYVYMQRVSENIHVLLLWN